VFVRQRGLQGDLYRCTAPHACLGLTLHYRRNRGACGIAAETVNGTLIAWTACPGQQPLACSDAPVDHLSTWQVAARLQIDTCSVVRLLATGKLFGLKVNGKWKVPSGALRDFIRDGPPRRRIARTA
jgi:hypothetical protein